MTPFQLQTLKKKIEEIRTQSTADLEAVCNVARMQHDYRLSRGIGSNMGGKLTNCGKMLTN